MSKRYRLAKIIMAMTYSELIHLAGDLVEMQKEAKKDGWNWKPDDVHGGYGLACMLCSWAEAQGEDD